MSLLEKLFSKKENKQENLTDRMQGIVKTFDSEKGYGFIVGDDGKEYFIHYSNIIMNDSITLATLTRKFRDNLRYEILKAFISKEAKKVLFAN